MGCFSTILVLVGFVLVMVTFIRWFEQTADAVDSGWWSKVGVLLACPFMVWLFPSRVGAGRASPVPLHEPVRGFGKLPRSRDDAVETRPADADIPLANIAPNVAPPGTPKEFLGLPKVGPAKPRKGVDPEQLAKLKQKMREQGMLPPDTE